MYEFWTKDYLGYMLSIETSSLYIYDFRSLWVDPVAYSEALLLSRLPVC
jgi:hypothetical protein